ncbi:caspase family protein [Myxacorys almedinensis]|uniref:Peptidase C14 n=1 Tax=Myxacorys almedinensis A TaxID=2690445 RepID=A0A8J7Z2J0_9CYAN|nr:caspase family protein [Myxacorys almedinensis]NDJ16996.1 peptidase C14 [Myxacorys almedinensis A]
MPPVGVGASRFAFALETGRAKLWVLLIGVNHYDDETLPTLRYAALDCQGLGEALTAATQAFPQKEFLIHHDLVSNKPTLDAVQASLQRLVTEAKAEDTILTYFSGHGIVDPASHQTVLCLANTQKQNAPSTGLCLQNMLQQLGDCSAHSQIVWLDACHSGNITLQGAKGQAVDPALLNPTPQLLDLLRQRAAKSRGFYALLSCDQGQQSWEFPDLGHGVFSYYLMRGLRGEAADAHGVIDADGLYRYVYHQTLQYVEQTNQQLRLVNQQKRNKGDSQFHSEYSLQTPKRIVEGVGETILGLKPKTTQFWQERQALLINGLTHYPLSMAFADVLHHNGSFDLECFPPADRPSFDCSWLEVRTAIARFLQSDPALPKPQISAGMQQIATRLLYLRGSIATSADGDSWLVLGDGVQISRAWLRQELRRSPTAQQIVILDCPGAVGLEDWLEDLKIASDYGQCILACASPLDEPELFAQVLLEALIAANPRTGLSIASLLAKLQTNLDGLGLMCHLWLSGTQGLIEVLPSTLGIDGSSTPPERESAAPLEVTAALLEMPKAPAQPLLEIGTPAIEIAETTLPVSDLAERLTPILLSLVGPVAPLVMAQAAAQADDPQGLIEELLLLVPAAQRATFEQQAQFAIQQAARSRIAEPSESSPEPLADASGSPTHPSPALSHPSSEHTPPHESAPDIVLSAESLAIVESVLLDVVGPITPVLLSHLPPHISSVAGLVATLSDYLSPQQCAVVEQRLSAAVPTATPPTVSQPPALVESLNPPSEGHGRGIADSRDRQGIDEKFIQTCEYELTLVIGPIAKWMVTGQREAIRACPTGTASWSSEAFVEALASSIPDARKAAEFRQRVLKSA